MRIRKVGLMVAVNLAVGVVAMLLAELGYRVYRDGVAMAWMQLLEPSPVPYSNLGTGNWMIQDDELGFRLNPAQDGVNQRSVRHRPIAVPRPADWRRVVVLGDSLLWKRPSLVDYWRDSVPPDQKLELINASTPGYSAYQEVTFYQRFLADTAPDLVVWVYCLNDNHRFLHSYNEQGKILMTHEAMENFRTHTWWDALISRSFLLTLARGVYLAHRERPRPAPGRYVWEGQVDFSIAWKDYFWSGYERQLRRLKGLLPGAARLAIVIVPYEPQLEVRADPNRAYVLKPQHKITAMCKEHNVACLDLFSAFADAYDRGQRLYSDGVHLNQQGHRLAHQRLAAFLAQRRLIPPSPARRSTRARR